MNRIDQLACTNTTSQIINHYKKNNLDIHTDMKSCAKGLRMALDDVLSKTAIRIRHEEPQRAEMDYKDVVESLRGED